MLRKSPYKIATETVTRIAALDARRLSGNHARKIAIKAIRADRQQLAEDNLPRRMIEAYEAYDGQDVDAFIAAWTEYLTGADSPCPETADGLHEVTEGSCDQCGSKNRN